MPIATFRTILAFVLVASLFGSTAMGSERAGDRAVERGAYPTAVDEYEDALDRNPDDVDLLVKLARTKTRLAGELAGSEAETLYEEAADHAARATELAPQNPEAHFELARALGRLGEFRGIFESLNLADRVQDELERTLELDPDHAGAHHALALWHFHVPWIAGGRSDRIRPLFERAIELEPESISHRRAYGEVLLELGDREAAREQLQVALELEADTFVGRQEQELARELFEEHF